MKLLFDEELVEAAVFLGARGGWKYAPVPDLQVRRFHGERERIYRILDPDDRNTAFFTLHLDWFREWRFEQYLKEVIARFPLVATELNVLGFRNARRKNEEGAELFVNSDGRRHGIVAFGPDRFRDIPAFDRFLNHELMHLRDMVAPEFGYSPALSLGLAAQSQERLVRERYRILWDVGIDGRLCRSGLVTGSTREKRQADLAQAFSFWTVDKREFIFDRFWENDEPHHVDLLEVASDPRDLSEAMTPLPGASCPLCQFPTFEWAENLANQNEVVQRICSEFPFWDESHGACQRCVDTYEAACRIALECNV